MIFIIAHRMRTVDGVDKIVVLKDGVVAEQGGYIYIYYAEHFRLYFHCSMLVLT